MTAVSVIAVALRVGPASAYDARLTWSLVPDSAGYKVYVRLSDEPYGSGSDVGPQAPGQDGNIHHVLTGLAPNTTNNFRVKSYNAAGVESAFSNELSLTLTATPSPPLFTPTPSATIAPIGTTMPPTRTASVAPTAAAPTAARPKPDGEPIIITLGAGGSNQVLLEYLEQAGPNQIRIARTFDEATNPGAAISAATGDVNGDGTTDLVVGQLADADQRRRDRVEVYEIGSDLALQRLTQVAAFGASRISSSGNLAVGDVDPTQPGDEIVVGEDGSRRPASRIRVLGGLRNGRLSPLTQFSGVPVRARARRPVTFALGDVFADTEHPGQEIVTCDAEGNVYVYHLRRRRAARVWRFNAFPDAPCPATCRLAVGDLMPDAPGDEIVVGDDGTRQDGLVRILDPRNDTVLLEFNAFSPGYAPDGVEIWVADVIATSPGAELIVGQGAAGGELRVFSIADGRLQHVLDIPDPLHRTTSLRGHLAAGNLLANIPGNEVAVAQTDPNSPVQVFHLDPNGPALVGQADALANQTIELPIATIAIAQ